jgi:hypothetical protein
MNVEVVGDELAIDVVIEDPVAARLVEEAADDDDRLEVVAAMIEIGARVLQRQQDGAQGDLLRREIERMQESLERAQRGIVEHAGRDFSQAVQSVMVEVSQQLTSLHGRLEGALAVAAKDQELAAERERGTAKGRPFEERVADRVMAVARFCGDSADRTGDVGGIAGRAGDVVVEIEGATGAPRGSIVFEAKTGRLSKPEMMRELDRALEARGADFAVLVVAGRGKMPANTYELREYGGNKMVCAIEEGDDTGLEVAYSLARARVLLASAPAEGVDVGGARRAIEQAVQRLDDVRKVKLKMTAVQGAAEEAKNMVDDMTNSIRSTLERAQELL